MSPPLRSPTSSDDSDENSMFNQPGPSGNLPDPHPGPSQSLGTSSQSQGGSQAGSGTQQRGPKLWRLGNAQMRILGEFIKNNILF